MTVKLIMHIEVSQEELDNFYRSLTALPEVIDWEYVDEFEGVSHE